MKKLEGKVALITGAAVELGKGIATVYAKYANPSREENKWHSLGRRYEGESPWRTKRVIWDVRF